ncbi:hypothetical protein [Pseudoalteromonas sp. S4741]|uniref:hypothetical protein n=1 Tax=Pseudoalteromonas sp. S4741 TaxID=579563 RepID=UPI00110AA39F|nr:hypothetical protein [Pseudoalteromonas sp. S4741]TMO22078.1 hypothetical protein CWC30_12340 [Pseudoalteromonas sp. S4741]
MKYFFSVLIFFPSITFSLLKAEIFPYGLLYTFTQPLRVYSGQLLFIICMLASCVYGVFFHGYFSFEIVRSLFAYLNAFLLFYIILNLNQTQLWKLVYVLRKVFYFLIVLGCLQFSGLATVLRLDVIMDFLMARGGIDVMGHGRGISLMSSEPSRAGIEFIFIYAVFRYSIPACKVKYYDLFSLFFVLFFIRSATALLFLIVLYSMIYRRVSLGVFVVGVFGGGAYLNTIDIANIRSLHIFKQVLSTASFNDFVTLFANTSGFRGISVYSSYLYGFENVFGGGVGYWEVTSVQALNQSGVSASNISYFSSVNNGHYSSVRPTSFVASVALDMGIIGVTVLCFALKKLFLELKKTSLKRPILITFLFYLFVLGSIGNPVPWVCTAIILNKNYFRILEGKPCE